MDARLSRTGHRLSLRRFGILLLASLGQAEREVVRGRSWQVVRWHWLRLSAGKMDRTMAGRDVSWSLL